jgi:hypothetical protein
MTKTVEAAHRLLFGGPRRLLWNGQLCGRSSAAGRRCRDVLSTARATLRSSSTTPLLQRRRASSLLSANAFQDVHIFRSRSFKRSRAVLHSALPERSVGLVACERATEATIGLSAFGEKPGAFATFA